MWGCLGYKVCSLDVYRENRERTSSAIVWQILVLSQVEVVFEVVDLPEDEGYEGDGNDEHVKQVEAASAESVFVQDEPVGDDLQDQLNREDGREKVVKIVENLQEKGIRPKISKKFTMDVLHYSSGTVS